jgi:hypothetical protein
VYLIFPVARTKVKTEIKVPSPHDWRTTDADEINKRRLRAREETFRIENVDPSHPIYSNFSVRSGSKRTYSVEIRNLRDRHFACDCVDFRINGLGTCKHVEAVLLFLESRFRRLYTTAVEQGSSRIEIVPDLAADTLRVCNGHGPLTSVLKKCFNQNGLLIAMDPEEALVIASRITGGAIRISQEVRPWLEQRRCLVERKELRREYEMKVQSGEWPAQETLSPLFPYQREGMLHLAFNERALLADEMGLGKTIQAIGACALLHRLGKARRVLVVTPASLKTEWEEQIGRFTTLPYQLIFGRRSDRLAAYANAPFFTIVNYEQMLVDSLDVNTRLRPDIIVLDEAQRIKNWSTKTTQAIKRLQSRYAFVLTGTPIENRIDELHSLMDFLAPQVLGPLFRFNREYYELDDRGRPCAYRNLEKLHQRIAPYMLRRRKIEVETELPDRTDRTHFVTMSEGQIDAYGSHEAQVARLANIARRRPLSKQEQDKLMREMAMMRMICDTNYILDHEDRVCPKLAELEKVLDECRENADVKVIVFSEWERMLELVRELCERLDLGYAWHTGSVPQRRRRAEITAFKSDENCRVFLSTDSGSTGLNLQAASVIINCDLPWNPAKLEQRIARAWRKHQTRPVTVINLVSEKTIEHRMLDTLSHKQSLADGVLDLKGDLGQIRLTRGKQNFLAKLEQLLSPASVKSDGSAPARDPIPMPADPCHAFAHLAGQELNGALVHCEERYPAQGSHSVLYVVVDCDTAKWSEKLSALHQKCMEKNNPLAPVQLEIIDRATHEALQRLIASGLISKTTRATRPLMGVPGAESVCPLSEEERKKAEVYRLAVARKLKMARLLGQGGFNEETREALLEAILQLGRALAVENRLPEPADLNMAMEPPLSHCWKERLSLVRGYAISSVTAWEPILKILETPGL